MMNVILFAMLRLWNQTWVGILAVWLYECEQMS